MYGDFGIKINIKEIKSLRLGISDDWRWNKRKVTLDNEKINQGVSFNYLVNIISKDGRSSEDVKNRIAKTQGVFKQLKEGLEE